MGDLARCGLVLRIRSFGGEPGWRGPAPLESNPCALASASSQGSLDARERNGSEGDRSHSSAAQRTRRPGRHSRAGNRCHCVQPSINLVGSGDAWSGYATDGDTPTPRDAMKWLDAFGLRASSRAGTGRQPAEELSWRRKRKPMGATSNAWWQRRAARRTLRWSKALRPRATAWHPTGRAATREEDGGRPRNDGEKASAAVTRHGYRRGESSEG